MSTAPRTPRIRADAGATVDGGREKPLDSGEREVAQEAPSRQARSLFARARHLVVVVPTFNEAENLRCLVWALLGLKLPGVRLSVLIVDDNSPDGTGLIADELAARHGPRVAVLHRNRREGLGRAYVHAFGVALAQGADLVVQMDADFSHDPQAIPSLLAALPGTDMVLGSRFLPGSRIEADWPWSRRLLSWFANSVYVRLLLGATLRDMTGGFRLWRVETLAGMDLPHRIRSSGFVFQVEMAHVCQRLGYRVREVPITFAERLAGKSKMSLRIQLEAAWRAWELKWRFRGLSRFSEPSAGTHEAAQATERSARTRPTFWQRRYLLRHYRRFSDADLAAGSGLTETVVQGFLDRQGATRPAGDLRRLEQAGRREPPPMFTLATARRVVTRLAARPLSRLDGALVLGMFLASLLLYAATAARTVTGEDAGELLAAAHGFGVPHPPGYPLWLLLSWASDHVLPFGTVAWRVSLVSALPAAAANALLLLLGLKTLRHRLAALTAAALFAVSRTHWTQAVIPEVYGLNTFFLAAQVVLLVRLAERPSAGRLIALAAITGLSATNHTSALPMALVFGTGAVLVAPALFRRPVVVLGALVTCVMPLLLYGVLVLASTHQPYLDWGNPETAESLWHHATRAQYADVQAEQLERFDHGDYLRRLQILAEWAGRQFGSSWVLLLAVVGALALFLRHTGLWLLLVVIGWLSSVGITRYTSFPFEREHIYANQIFFIPAWFVLAWLMGGGLDVVLERIARNRRPWRRPAFAACAAGCLVLIAVPATAHFARADRSRTTAIARYGKALLDAMEPGALYFPNSDHSTFTVLYWQGVEGYRPDVTVADKYGRVEPEVLGPLLDDGDRAILATIRPGDRRAFEESVLIRKWPGPVYFANKRETRDVPGRVLEPVGPVFQAMTEDQAVAWWAGDDPPGLAAWEPWLPLLEFDERERLDFTVQMVQGDLLYMRGYALLRAGRVDEALATWDRIAGDLAPLKQGFNNIGAALAEEGLLTEAIPYFARAREEDSRYVLARRNEAFVRKNRGEKDVAIVLLREALSIDPTDRLLRFELAALLDETDQPLAALAAYEALAATDPEDAEPWRQAGHLLRRRGDLAKARDAYIEALRLKPGIQDCAEWLDRLRRGLDEAEPWAAMGAQDHGPEDHSSDALSASPVRSPSVPAPGPFFDPSRSVGFTAPR